MTPGQIAYEAYSVAVGGVSAVTGTVLPSWAGTTDQIRAAWEAAAGAVLDWAGALEMTKMRRDPDVVVLPADTPPPA